MNVRSVDNLLPNKYLGKLLKYVDTSLVWQWRSETSGDYFTPNNTEFNLWDKQMMAPILDKGKPCSDHHLFFLPILSIIEEKFNVDIKDVVRMKVNKTFTIPSDIEVECWHTDSPVTGAKSVVFYLDSSDGNTIVSNTHLHEVPKQGNFSTDMILNSNLTTIQHKRNRAIMFDSSVLHYGEYPKTHKCRTVLNIVFT